MPIKVGLQVPPVQIMDVDDVDRLGTEPVVGLLQRAHEAVVGEVEHGAQRQRSHPATPVGRLAATIGYEVAADLGGQ